MNGTYRLEMENGDAVAAVRGFLQKLLGSAAVHALLAPMHLPMKSMVMPSLATRSDRLEGVDPLAPCFPLNAARIASRLARKPMGARWAAVLRPCEVRALVELAKLKQARLLGAYSNTDYLALAGADPSAATGSFLRRALAGDPMDPPLAAACRVCELPVPPHSDLHIGLVGAVESGALLLEARSPAGR